MKLRRRSRSARTQLSDKLFAYSTAATAAALAAVSTARAGAYDASLTFSPGSVNDFPDDSTFTVGNATFTLSGYKSFRTTKSYSGTYVGTPENLHYVRTETWTYTYRSARLSLAVAGGQLTFGGHPFTAYNGGHGGTVFGTDSSSVWENVLGGDHDGTFGFQTSSGLTGVLNIHLGFTGNDLNGISGFTVSLTAIPEPADIAYGLGLVALGYAGIREHRRRRAAAKLVAVD